MINRGEFVYIVGPSGSGKSTLLNCIFRAELPSSGNIFIDNYSLNTLASEQIPYLRRNLGMIFQDFKLLPNKSIFDNIAYGLRGLGVSEFEIQKRVAGALNLVGLLERAEAFPDELSGGEQQRVGIARAIVQGPPLVIADEPTGNLDPKTSIEIFNLLKSVSLRGTTVIVSTHNHKIVKEFKERVLVLEDGKLVNDTLLSSVSNPYA